MSRASTPLSIRTPGVHEDLVDAAVLGLNAPKQEYETQDMFEQCRATADRVRHTSMQGPPMPTTEVDTTSYDMNAHTGGNTPPITPIVGENAPTNCAQGIQMAMSPWVMIQVPEGSPVQIPRANNLVDRIAYQRM